MRPTQPFVPAASEHFDTHEAALAIDMAIMDAPAPPRRSRHPQSNVTCPKCGLGFSSQGNLNRHDRTSHQFHRVKCDIPGCLNDGFSQTADLHRHLRRNHPDIAALRGLIRHPR